MLCMSKMSKMVFAVLTQHCIQSTVTHLTHVEDVEDAKYYCTLYTGPLAPPGGKATVFIWAFCPVGLAVHHHAVRGGSFVLKCSWTCQTTRVIAGKTHSQSPILKCYGGAQQPGNSYKSMTKLHPPHPNKLPACTEFWSEKCLQCLKTVGLYNSFGGGRFSFWQSLLTWASRCANSQASASNAWVPGDPNSPESNCSYLALILSVKELYSLCASCTVIK